MVVEHFNCWLTCFALIQVGFYSCKVSHHCKVKYDWKLESSSICFTYAVKKLLNYYEAVDYCKSLHSDMHLPIVKDRHTMKMLTDELESAGLSIHFFFGAKKENGTYLWADGSVLPENSKLWHGASGPNSGKQCLTLSPLFEVEDGVTYRGFKSVDCSRFNAKVVVCSSQTVSIAVKTPGIVNNQSQYGTAGIFSKSPTLGKFEESFISGVEKGENPLLELEATGVSAAMLLLNSSKVGVTEVAESGNWKFELKTFNVSSFQGATFSSIGRKATINIPKSLLNSGQGKINSTNAATVGIAYSSSLSSEIKLENTSKSSWKVDSDIISYSVVHERLNFTQPVTLMFSYKTQETVNLKLLRICAYWNTTANSWSKGGCVQVFVNSSVIICHCYHLTVFAALVQVGSSKEIEQLSESEVFVVTTLTHICFAFSYIGLLITIICHSSKVILRKECGFIRMNLSISILLAQTVYLVGIEQTKNETACKLIAVMLHYVYVAVGCWMLAEGINMVLMTITLVRVCDNRWKYALLGWVTPLVIVASSFATLHKSYGRKKSCWLSVDDGAIWAFAGPMLLILLLNIGALIVTIRATLNVRINRSKTETERLRVGIKSIIVLWPLLGLSWITGFFAIGPAAKIMQILFSISNALQGFFIFVFHCSRNAKINRTGFSRMTFSGSPGSSNNKVFPSGSVKKSPTKVQVKSSVLPNAGPGSFDVSLPPELLIKVQSKLGKEMQKTSPRGW
eukprot:gene5643-6339_t